MKGLSRARLRKVRRADGPALRGHIGHVLPLEEGRQNSPLFAEDVRPAVTALASVQKKKTPQSTAPRAVAAALEETKRWLALELERRAD